MKGVQRVAWACLVAVAQVGCSLEPVPEGAACERSAQCAAGLACVEHECTTDLSSVADQSMVPDFGGPDGSLDAAAPGDGGAVMGSDGAVVAPMDASTTPDTGASPNPDPNDDAG